MQLDSPNARRALWFGLGLLLSFALFWKPLAQWLRFAIRFEHLSHTPLIPGLSAVLIWWDRKRVFSSPSSSWGFGLGLLFLSPLTYGMALLNAAWLGGHDYLSMAVLAVAIAWLAIFALCFGRTSVRAASFPLLFLLLMVPIPELLLNQTIAGLQRGSAAVVSWLFSLSGVPMYRDDLVFSLPGLTIEVAEECSGIRSSIALLMTGLLAGHFFLRSRGGKALLILSIIPLALVKNAVRIVTLSLLGIYVDRSFITGNLHRRGGFVFFLFTLALMGIIMSVILRFERKRHSPGMDFPRR